MTRITHLARALFVASAVLATAAVAQPSNDTCATAISLGTLPANGSPVSSAQLSGLNLLASGVESTFNCGGSTPSRSVWFSFTTPATGSYTISSCDLTNFDSVLQVYDGNGGCGALTPVSGSCIDQGCPSGNASALSAQALQGGRTYYVQITGYGSTTVTASSLVGLAVNYIAPPANDRCDGTVPQLSINAPYSFAINLGTTNDSIVGGILDGGSQVNNCFQGFGHSTTASANQAPGRDVVFGFTPPANGSYNVRLTAFTSNANTVLYLTDSCVAPAMPPQTYAPPQCIAASNRVTSSTTAGEDLHCVPLTSGVPYFVWADETSASTATTSGYEIEVTPCVREIEPNNTPATAAPVSCPVVGTLFDAGVGTQPDGGPPAGSDVDFFSLGTPPAGSRAFALVDGYAAASSDFDLRITTDVDSLEYDDANADGLFGPSSGAIAGTPLTGAPAYARVSFFSNGPAREPYRLYTAVQTGAPTPEAEPNDAIATSSGGATNYFTGEVSSTTDVDFFAFSARAGQLVFLALDSNPSRTYDGGSSSGNHTLALQQLDGGALVAVNDSTTAINVNPSDAGLAGTTPTAPAEALVYRIREDGTFVARVGRTSSSGQGAYLLSVSTDCSTGGGISAPSVSNVAPTTGTISGGTSLVISGTDFNALTRVTVGGAAATVTARTASSLTVSTPPGPEGAAAIVVTNPGNQAVTYTGFTYFTPIEPPTITSVSPTSGPTAGGTVLTINGTLFKPNVEVTFTVNGTTLPGTAITIINPAQLRVTTPAHAAGDATITVRNPADDLPTSRPNAFTYLAPPAITNITPNTGLTTGGLTITISGSAFRTGAIVRFGAIAGTNVVIDPSGTSLTVTTPSATANGPVNVTIVNTDTQQVVASNAFTYAYPQPTITSVTPSSGFTAGGTPITIDGTGFQTGPTVTVGGVAATTVVRVSLTRITAVTPAGSAGLVDVVVTNSDSQTVTLPASFRYVPPPALTAITPTHGPRQGGTLITITGQNFQAGAVVRLGGVPAFAVTVRSPTEATAITNGASAGAVDVQVVNPDTQAASLPAAFTFDAAPEVISLTPTTGSTAGGTTLTITGTGFLQGATVLLGSTAATGVNVVSATELTAVTPARPVGVVSVTVRNDDGQASELARAFRFVAPPTVTAAAPNTGDVRGGTVVTLTGTGFAAGATVKFDGVEASNVTVVSETTLEATSPAHAPGAVAIEVTSGGASASLANGFTYTRGAPTLTAVAPLSGPIAGGTLLTLSGSGFAPGATVTVGGSPATDVVVVSEVLARAVAPAHAAGAVDVVITNDDAQAATLANAFTYVAPMTGEGGTVVDGGSGSIGQDPVVETPVPGGVSCGCSSFDASSFSLAGFGLLMVLSRRRRRS